MCLIVIAYRAHPDYPVIIAANRDEFYARPTRPMAVWDDDPTIVAGRDLEGGGTWMGISRRGRLAALTNYREPGRQVPSAPSRGHLVSDFLMGGKSLNQYIEDVEPRIGDYNGFNLLLSENGRWLYTSNRAGSPRYLSPGIHGLSNHLLDTPWPKVRRSCRAVETLLDARRPPDMETLMAVLQDRTIPEDAELPDTGIGIAWERRLGAVFIHSPVYGTRASTVLIAGRDGEVRIRERTFDVNGTTGERGHTLRLAVDQTSRRGTP